MKKDLFSLEMFIAKILRYGVMVSALCILIGWGLSISSVNRDLSLYTVYSSQSLVSKVLNLWSQQQWGQVISYVGLSILILLPFVRVLLTAFIFLRQKEKAMLWLCLTVVSGLLFSFYMGFEI